MEELRQQINTINHINETFKNLENVVRDVNIAFDDIPKGPHYPTCSPKTKAERRKKNKRAKASRKKNR